MNLDRASFLPPLLNGLSALPARLDHGDAAVSVLVTAWRRRLFVICVVLAGLLVSVIALGVLKKTYQSEAIIQLDLSKREGNMPAEQAAQVSLDASAIVQSEARIIRSRAVMSRVVDRLGLAEPAKPGWIGWALVPSGIRDAILPGRSPDDSGTNATETAINRLTASVTVESDNRSYLVTIRATADQPARAAQIANAVAEAYIERRLRANVEAADRSSAWLGQQIGAVTAQLRDAEASVAEQREKTGLLEFRGDGERLDQQQIRDVAAQLSASSLARITEEARLARVQELQRAGTVLSSVDLQSYPMVQQLVARESTARKDLADIQSRFGPRHPAVLQAQAGLAEIGQALAKEVERALSVLEASAETARRTEQTLKERLDTLRQAMLLGRGGEVEYRDRVAAAQAVRDRLATLTRSREQVLAQREQRMVAASIIVLAEPVRIPAYPKPMVVLALGVLAGLGAGVGGALLLDRADNGLRTMSSVPAETGQRCLGLLPKPGGQSPAVFDEAVRAVGAGIGLFGAGQECQVVVVTSSLNYEGAEVMCRGLSRSLVAAGQRVLVIDGTPSRPERAPTSETSGPRPEDGSKQLTVLSTDMLSVVHRNSAVALSADVFGSGRFARVLEQARKHFDVILIEAPPVLLVADALVLGRMADRFVLVTRWASTPRKVVLAALARLQENSISVDGIALTGVDLRRQGRASVADQCTYYLRERRYYERLSGPDKPATADISRAA